MNKLYIFDKDKTLVSSTTKYPPNKPEQQILMPGVAEVCRELREAGHVLAIASNQGGVAFGLLSPEKANAVVKDAAQRIGAVDFEVCYHHPNGRIAPFNQECPMRKPEPGMLVALMDRLGFSPEQTIFIGDSPEDEKAAQAAGVQFFWAKDFFAVDGNA